MSPEFSDVFMAMVAVDVVFGTINAAMAPVGIATAVVAAAAKLTIVIPPISLVGLAMTNGPIFFAPDWIGWIRPWMLNWEVGT